MAKALSGQCTVHCGAREVHQCWGIFNLKRFGVLYPQQMGDRSGLKLEANLILREFLLIVLVIISISLVEIVVHLFLWPNIVDVLDFLKLDDKFSIIANLL